MDRPKYWLEYTSGNHDGHHYGMSSALGCKVEDLPTEDVPNGSDCFDYSTKKIYMFDGVSWK